MIPTVEPVSEKKKKTFITPEEREKRNLANSLFGGGKTKGPSTLKGPTTKTTQPSKKV